MTSRNKELCERYVKGESKDSLSERFSISIPTIDGILYGSEGTEYRKLVKEGKHISVSEDPRQRLSAMASLIIEDLNKEMDTAKTAEERAALAPKITDAVKLLSAVDVPELQSLGVVILPAVLSVQEFDKLRTLLDRPKDAPPESPTAARTGADGSKMSTQTQNDSSEETPPEEERSDEWEDVSMESDW